MKREINTKFFKFDQSNPGGKYHITDTLKELVIIEAIDANHANSIAESIDIYFDGVENDRDCCCCSDRWDRVDDEEGTPELPEISKHYKNFIIYYLDGLIQEVL